MKKPINEIKKPRSFKATDAGWQTIKDKAAAAGLSASEFIRASLLNNLMFVITETLPLRKPKKMTLVFSCLDDGRISCGSAEHQRMIDAFIGLDGIIYGKSSLFDDYDFEIDDGKTVIYKRKPGA